MSDLTSGLIHGITSGENSAPVIGPRNRAVSRGEIRDLCRRASDGGHQHDAPPADRVLPTDEGDLPPIRREPGVDIEPLARRQLSRLSGADHQLPEPAVLTLRATPS